MQSDLACVWILTSVHKWCFLIAIWKSYSHWLSSDRCSNLLFMNRIAGHLQGACQYDLRAVLRIQIHVQLLQKISSEDIFFQNRPCLHDFFNQHIAPKPSKLTLEYSRFFKNNYLIFVADHTCWRYLQCLNSRLRAHLDSFLQSCQSSEALF